MALWNGIGQVASIAQLAGVDAYGLITMIVEAARTVRRNKETCHQLAQRVKMIGDLLQQLPSAQLMEHLETRNPVEQLEGALRQAYMLIMSCQERSYVYSYFTGGKQAGQLRKVGNEISFYLQLFPLVGFVDTTRTLARILNEVHPSGTQAAKEGQMVLNSCSSSVSWLGFGDAETVKSGVQGVYKPLTVEEQRVTRKEKLNGQVVNLSKLVKQFCAERGSRLSLFNFNQIVDFTDNFKSENMVGQGGFGYVYKGKLPNGFEIAVKRLALSSLQGSEEFTTEIEAMVNLQHKNIIRLLGFCIRREKKFLRFHIQEEEKILIYEYMPNNSLASFIHDTKRLEFLNWSKRIQIIEGIAQGVVYLHEHFHQCVVHMDLKTSNILLDSEMNAKISDFGLARMVASDVTEGTDVVRGTYGYVAPEYVRSGKFSVKCDVYSFGIILLEIISQKRTVEVRSGDQGQCRLTNYAFELWKAGRLQELIYPPLRDEHQIGQIIRCIQVALLCVELNPADRPMMSDVVLMLRSKSKSLPVPKQPAASS